MLKIQTILKEKCWITKILLGLISVLTILSMLCAAYNSFPLRMWLQNRYPIGSDIIKQIEITTQEKRAYELIEEQTESTRKMTLSKIRNRFPYGNALTIYDILFVDLIDKQNNRRILCKKDGEFYKYIKTKNTVWVNISNKSISTLEISQELLDRNNYLELK